MSSSNVEAAVSEVIFSQRKSNKPLAIILAGHNGSGKSTMWYHRLANRLQIPLVNADRMMMSILPEPDEQRRLPPWATELRDRDEAWMGVAQKGVQSFVAQAMAQKVPFATETVFSHWHDLGNGVYRSKIDVIHELQAAGYYVLLLFVGLANVALSELRVLSRVAEHGHGVAREKLLARFPRTQRAIGHAVSVADASILVDNSLGPEKAFRVARVQLREKVTFDIRRRRTRAPAEVTEWLDVVCPHSGGETA